MSKCLKGISKILLFLKNNFHWENARYLYPCHKKHKNQVWFKRIHIHTWSSSALMSYCFVVVVFVIFVGFFMYWSLCVGSNIVQGKERDNCTAVLLAACCMPGKTGLAQEVKDHPFLATCKPISIAMWRYIKSQAEGSSLFTHCFSYLEIWDSSEA